MKKTFAILLAVASLGLGGCIERITTGEIGLRVNASKEVQPGELMPGSWNQTVVGSVLTFPVRDVTMALENRTPMTSDSSALEDFDITVIYSINPTSVSDLWSTKARSFHAYSDGDWYLMFRYVETLVNNASYKVVRQYKALEIADNRAKIEEQVRDVVTEQLKADKLDSALTLTTVQVRNIQPNKQILAAATEYVRAQNELKIKETEVQIARKEAERMSALAQNSTQSIAYMEAQSKLTIANAIANGKVGTIIVPSNFTGLMFK
jgi:regulator of protease activity HflC (stomatin/prohibitin superfamily)